MIIWIEGRPGVFYQPILLPVTYLALGSEKATMIGAPSWPGSLTNYPVSGFIALLPERYSFSLLDSSIIIKVVFTFFFQL